MSGAGAAEAADMLSTVAYHLAQAMRPGDESSPAAVAAEDQLATTIVQRFPDGLTASQSEVLVKLLCRLGVTLRALE